MKRKTKIELKEFVEATGFLYRLGKIHVTKFDFSCLFEKDLTMAQKRKLIKRFGNDVGHILKFFLFAPSYREEIGMPVPRIRKNIKITHNFKAGTYGVNFK